MRKRLSLPPSCMVSMHTGCSASTSRTPVCPPSSAWGPSSSTSPVFLLSLCTMRRTLMLTVLLGTMKLGTMPCRRLYAAVIMSWTRKARPTAGGDARDPTTKPLRRSLRSGSGGRAPESFTLRPTLSPARASRTSAWWNWMVATLAWTPDGSSLTSSPTLSVPCSTLPASTLPTPGMRWTSSTVTRRGASSRRAGMGASDRAPRRVGPPYHGKAANEGRITLSPVVATTGTNVSCLAL
mmetsp:Transcript_6055/g.20367  ORF Transcript_6055/g.20367 Transcript_6055/m.20367 type:complete len:238 (-) Transcript_6055:432-1145(-)